MQSLMTTTLMLLTLSPKSVTWSLDGDPPRKTNVSQTSCDQYASCTADHVNTCFCDRVCRIYGDCCPDYVDTEGDRQLTPLPSRLFTCSWKLDYVYVITDCPDSDHNQYLRNACQLGSTSGHYSSNDIFYTVPVTSRSSGLVYRNVYCAICHEEDDVSFWNVTTDCPKERTSEPKSSAKLVENIDDLIRQESFVSRCVFLYSPMSDTSEPRRCVDVIAACLQDADAELASRCTRSSNVAYVYHQGDAYRNRDCAACYGLEDHDLDCTLIESEIKFRSAKSFESFAIVLDFNTGKAGLGGSVTQTLGNCPERNVYDPFTGTCRVIACPSGHYLIENGQCLHQSVLLDRQILISDAHSTKTADNLDCAWIQLNPSDYHILPNESIYIHFHDAIYDTDSYRLGDNQTVHLCTSFQRNYTEWIHETLKVDAVSAYLSLVCSLISLPALAFQFTVYMAFPVLRNTPGRCIICLVVSLFVAQLLFLLVKTGRSVSPEFCFGQAATMHFAFTAAFFWMNAIAVDVYRTFAASPAAIASSSSPSGARRSFAAYSVYAWISAALFVSVGVTLDLAGVGGTYRPHYGHRVCWFGSRGGLLLLFGVPVGIILTANIILFSLSVRHIRSASRASQMAIQKTDQTQLLVIYVKLSVVMGLGWVLGFVAAFTDWPALWYIFIIINSLQGALLCVVFVVTRQVLKLLADCVRPLCRRVAAGTSSSSELSPSKKTPAISYDSDRTAVIRLSLPVTN